MDMTPDKRVEEILRELNDWGWNTSGGVEAFRHAQYAKIREVLTQELQKARAEERERIALLVDSLSISTGAPERAMEYKAAWQFGNDVLENAKRKLLKAINK